MKVYQYIKKFIKQDIADRNDFYISRDNAIINVLQFHPGYIFNNKSVTIDNIAELFSIDCDRTLIFHSVDMEEIIIIKQIEFKDYTY